MADVSKIKIGSTTYDIKDKPSRDNISTMQADITALKSKTAKITTNADGNVESSAGFVSRQTVGGSAFLIAQNETSNCGMGVSASGNGNIGLYDQVRNNWVQRVDTSGELHIVPFTINQPNCKVITGTTNAQGCINLNIGDDYFVLSVTAHGNSDTACIPLNHGGYWYAICCEWNTSDGLLHKKVNTDITVYAIVINKWS